MGGATSPRTADQSTPAISEPKRERGRNEAGTKSPKRETYDSLSPTITPPNVILDADMAPRVTPVFEQPPSENPFSEFIGASKAPEQASLSMGALLLLSGNRMNAGKRTLRPNSEIIKNDAIQPRVSPITVVPMDDMPDHQILKEIAFS